MADNNANFAGKSTTPGRAQSAPPQEHASDQTKGDRTAAARIYPGLRTVSLTESIPTWSSESGDFYEYHIPDPAKADYNRKKRAAFYEWRASHFAYDHPEEGREGGTIEEFLERFVPSPVDIPNRPETHQELAALAEKVTSADPEADTYPFIISLLNKCQEGLEDNKKLNFIDASNLNIPSPTKNDHFTAPDILGLYPGLPAPTTDHTFDQYCIAVEAELHSDPVAEAASTAPAYDYTIETIAKIANLGKNLLFASSACYAFVIGIYPKTQQMRIYRFDHSGSVSCGFNYLQKPHLVREFIWRFVNPHHAIPHTVVGWDETIQIPTDEEFETMKKIINPWYSWLKIDKKDCRWLRVRVNRASFPSATNDDYLPYYDLKGMSFGPPLYKSSRLFSRAPYVSRILVEIPGHGFHVFVIKDSWRPRPQTPESVYYEQIQQRFPGLKDLDSFKWVKDMYPEIDATPNWIPGLAEYYGYLDLSSCEVQFAAASSDDRGHTTVTRRLLNGDEASDRVRTRILTGPVGGSISGFAKTQDFVTAIRDAAVGHYIALCCGVLHRDVSVGNILFAREPSGQARGFLHDFDQATFYDCVFAPPTNEKVTSKVVDFKGLTGTPQFMAIGVIRKNPDMPYHDLESLYWVIVFILLKHGDHLQDPTYAHIFTPKNMYTGVAMKHCWITQCGEPLVVKNNAPLSELMKFLRGVLKKYHSTLDPRRVPTHEMFIQALDESVRTEGWLEDDRSAGYRGARRVEAFRLDSQRPCLSKGRKRRAACDGEERKNKKIRS